jgi:MFS family permease
MTTVSAPNAYPRAATAWYLLGVLVIVSVLSFVDRQILVLLVQPLRHDLAISDTEISLLQGFAFTILYSFLGLPLGRYADRHNRRNLIIVGLALWSAMTVACGLAQTYGQLFAARVGVGIGEATLAPAAYSMLCDAFEPRKRGTALGVYHSAIYMGIGVSVLLGGVVLVLIRNAAEVTLPLVGTVRSWQAAFMCVGAPGLVVALLLFTLREPPRHIDAARSAQAQSWSETGHYLMRYRTAFALQLSGYCCIALAAYGMGSWIPTYFIRIHHWPASQAGIFYGLMLSVLGTAGGVTGGVIGDRWLARGRADARLMLSLVAALFWMPLILLAVYTSDAWSALAFFGLASAMSSLINGLGPTTIQDIVPDWLRGQASALYFFVLNLLGLGVGPTAIALVTDRIFGDDAALRYSLPLVGIPAILLGCGMLLAARKYYREACADLGASNAPRVAGYGETGMLPVARE